MEPFKSLPEEITLDILTRLPTESVLNCKLVCTTWYNLISYHPSFSKMHLHHLNHPSSAAAAADSGKLGFIALTGNEKLYYFELPIQRIARIGFILPSGTDAIIGSYNGLICLSRYKQIYICNPVTREYLMLPVIKTDYCESNDTDRENNEVYWRSGFGYISSTNEYKVVSIMLTTLFAQVHIYTLGSGNCWRNLGKFNFGYHEDWGEGIFSKGVLYWLDDESDMIVTFDLAEEQFGEHLPSPPLPSDGSCSFYKIGVLDGFLSLVVWLDVEGAQCYEVWLLEKKNDEDHGMKEQPQEHKSMGWTREFRVDQSDLFAVTKTGNVLTYFDDYLNIYDTKASTSKRLVDFGERINQVFPHKNTLVSLKELGEEDTKVMESVEVTESDDGL